jgi:putrescine transport system substrate-binding protein
MCGRYVSPNEARTERIQPRAHRVEISVQLQCRVYTVRAGLAGKFDCRRSLVIRSLGGQRTGSRIGWGLIPFFSHGEPPKYPTIDARIETIEPTPSYRVPWKRSQRCLQVASDFFQWHMNDQRRHAREIRHQAAARMGKRRTRPLLRLNAGTAALLLLALLCGCGKTPRGSIGADPAVLNIYNWPDYIGRDTIAQFERETHIKVRYQTYDSSETLEAKMLVGHSGYDLVNTSTAFYERQIKAGVYQPLERSKLPNWSNLDPQVLAVQATADPGNRFAVPYLHAMNGIVYNIESIKKRMPDAPLDSLALIFDPKVISRLADCGVTFLDSPEDVIELALAYLHIDPNSDREDDLKKAEAVVMAVRPYIRTFDSNDYWHQLASGEACVSIAWSADFSTAQARAREDGTGAHLAFMLPKEGSNITYNAFLIPVDAPHADAAHQFLNFLMDPHVIAAVTNDTHYGNDNLASNAYVRAEILSDASIYPSEALRPRLYLPRELGSDYDRLRTRVWTRIKTGQ